MKTKQYRHSMILLLAATIWGTAFVFQAKGMEYMKPFTFSASRNLLGCMILLPVIWVRMKGFKKSINDIKKENHIKSDKDIKKENHIKSDNNSKEEKEIISWKRTILGGICCGFVLSLASLLQQYGIQYTTVGKAGFITTLYILFTPILGIFLKKRVPRIVWVACVIAAFGMYLLCIQDSMSIQLGDTLVFLCAIAFAVHILVIDYFSPNTDEVIISCIQFFVCFLISGILAIIFDHPTLGEILDGIIPVLYAGIMSSGVAYTLQIVGQKGLSPSISALILSMESVIATIAAYFAYYVGFVKEDQTLTTRQIFGCVIVFFAVLLVQIPWKRNNKNE